MACASLELSHPVQMCATEDWIPTLHQTLSACNLSLFRFLSAFIPYSSLSHALSHTHARTHTQAHARTHAYTHTHTHTRTHTHTHTRTHRHTDTHTETHTHTHTHKNTHRVKERRKTGLEEEHSISRGAFKSRQLVELSWPISIVCALQDLPRSHGRISSIIHVSVCI